MDNFLDRLKAFFVKVGSSIKTFFVNVFRGIKAFFVRLYYAIIIFFSKLFIATKGLFTQKKWVWPTAQETGIVPANTGLAKARTNELESTAKRDRQALAEYRKANREKRVRNAILIERDKTPNFLVAVIVTTVRMLVVLVILVGVAMVGAVIGVAKAYIDTTPVLNFAEIENQDQTSFIYDSNGELLTTYKGLENRINAPISEIPLQLQDAFIAIEDSRFRSHQGIDIKRIVGAFVTNLQSGSNEGGSTITQQLIKLTMLTSEQSYKRKIQEAYLALQLEENYTKDQILEAYLNIIPMGGSTYGVKAAAIDYFDKEDLNTLTLRECATLASITRNPTYYNPRLNYYSRQTPEATDKRGDIVLKRMFEAGYITQAEYDDALYNQKLQVVEVPKTTQLYDMATFVEYGVYDVISAFLKSRDMFDTRENRTIIERELRTSGYRIYLTVQPEIQKGTEATMAQWDKYPALASGVSSTYRTTNPDGTINEKAQPQAASVIIDHTKNEIVAMVGGRTPPQQAKEFNRAYQSVIQVGSSIKPLAVYGPALDLGASPATVIINAPIRIDGWDTERGYPNNFGGGGFTGVSTLRNAIVRSLNYCAGRLLLENVGLETSANYLELLGVNSDHISVTGSGLSLGTSPITPLEMAVAYSVIANGGVFRPCYAFSRVVDGFGNTILDAEKLKNEGAREVFKPDTDWMLVDLLKNAVNSGTGGNAKINGITTAGKTGTNSDFHGVFFAGFTPYYTASIWIGHDGGAALSSAAQGGNAAAPLWKAIMQPLHNGLADKPILPGTAEELGWSRVRICAVSGMRATDVCELDTKFKPVTEYVRAQDAPKDRCTLHRKADICTESKLPVSEYCPKEVEIRDSEYLFIDKKSPLYALRTIPNDTLQGYFEGIVMEIDRPKDTDYVCNLHTEAWHNENLGLLQQIEAGKTAIINAENWMTQAGDNLSAADRTAITNAITQLRSKSEDAAKQPVKPQSGVTRITANDIRVLVDNLNRLVAESKDRTNLFPFGTPTPSGETPTSPTPTRMFGW